MPLIEKVVLTNNKVTLGYDSFGQYCKTIREDNREVSEIIADVRGRTCCICQRPWDANIADDLINHMCLDTPSSKEEYDKARFCHETCYLGHLNINERNLITKALRIARGQFNFRYTIEPIPNEYRGAYNTDWYIIQFPDSNPVAQLKFGSRKRVWVLQLTTPDKFNIPELAHTLAKGENVTCTINDKEIMFHAWTKEKVIEYLSVMMAIVGHNYDTISAEKETK